MHPSNQPNPNPYGTPGQNPYGSQGPPPAQPNPYGPPAHDPWADTQVDFDDIPQGTYWGGFAAGFIFALLGLIVVYVAGKDETQRGALHGFGARLGVSVLVVLFVIAAG